MALRTERGASHLYTLVHATLPTPLHHTPGCALYSNSSLASFHIALNVYAYGFWYVRSMWLVTRFAFQPQGLQFSPKVCSSAPRFAVQPYSEMTLSEIFPITRFVIVVWQLSYDMYEAAYGGDATQSAARLTCRERVIQRWELSWHIEPSNR